MVSIHTYDRQGRPIKDGRGICGGYASLCSHCYNCELAELRTWVADKPKRNPGENPGDYWRRIGGKFYDAWYEVAFENIETL